MDRLICSGCGAVRTDPDDLDETPTTCAHCGGDLEPLAERG